MSGPPGGISNGPSRNGTLDKDAQIWERPWTLEEMQQSGASWSLAADTGLFLFLQDFSQKMLSKTHEIEKQLDSLIRDTKATDSCLHSVFNDFLMLSNTQFIENRVYDEEVEEAVKTDGTNKQPEQEKTREQKEAELIPKMQEAVNYGLRVLESAFEHLDIKAGNSDSEDEEVPDKVDAILEPKDLYVDRPLPYLIGSKAFMEQDDVGLGDLSSDEMSVDSDRELESGDDKESDHSDEDFDQEEEGHNNIAKKSSILSYDDDEEEEDDDEEEDSDIFGESDRDDEDDDATRAGPSSFADELAARIKGEAVGRPEGDRASLASKKKSKSKKEPKPPKQQAEDDNDDMFKPPSLDNDDFSPFGGKSGLFSGGRGLFDDDDGGDLFSEEPKPPVAEERKVRNESLKSADSDRAGKKILAGAVSVLPDNNLFGARNDSDSVGSKEDGTPTAIRQVPAGGSVGGGGLFEDEDGDDDFFSAQQEKVGAKKPIDLFAEDDEDGDIFSEKYSTPAASKKEAEKEQPKQPEKKMPAGAISLFGPGTKSLLNEGLKKRRPSTSEESNKSEENGPAPDSVKAAVKPPQKLPARGLFSDDEDSQEFPAIPKSKSKPEISSHSKTSKAALSLFDDEEEEDLFASAVNSNPKSSQAKAATPQPSKAASGSLFSDDEEQWQSSKSSAGKPEVKTGGMKPSASAPSGLPSAKTSHRSLFDDADDDLFAPQKETSQKKPQKVSLLFEDEDDDFNRGLFGAKPAASTSAAVPPTNKPAAASLPPTQVEKSEEPVMSKTPSEDKPSERTKPALTKTPETVPTSASQESSEGKKKPAGAVSLFGGIDVFASKQVKSPLDKADDDDDDDDGFLSKSSPPPMSKKEEKVKKSAVSLFDDDDDEEEESDRSEPIFAPSKAADKNAAKPVEEKQQAKSTGVFQDEELLFSQAQQKDNDPDVDLFSAAGKAANSKSGAAKAVAPSLFSDDDEDDLFGSVKTKEPPPKVPEKSSKPNNKAPLSPESPSEAQKPAPSPVKPKDPSSRIGKLQANLMINPAALLPGAAPTLPAAASVSPSTDDHSPFKVPVSSSASTPVEAQAGKHAGEGVSFDSPAQITTLQSTHKTRAKVAAQRRPQSRTARQQAAQRSVADEDQSKSSDISKPSSSLAASAAPSSDENSQANGSPTPDTSTKPAASVPSATLPEAAPRPHVLTLPESKKEPSKNAGRSKLLPASDDYDIFASDGLFGVTSASSASASSSSSSTSSTRQAAKTLPPQATSDSSSRKDKSSVPSIFDDDMDDLFQRAKPTSRKEAKHAPFLDEDDEDEDIFRFSSSSTPTSTSSKETGSNVSKQDIFQDDAATVPKVQKKQKTAVDVNLFDDNFDIFADLTDTTQPKHKSKSKGETKSIFDDDMDDIFASTTAKTVPKAASKSKKTSPSQETSKAADSSNIFDDPLNAFGN